MNLLPYKFLETDSPEYIPISFILPAIFVGIVAEYITVYFVGDTEASISIPPCLIGTL